MNNTLTPEVRRWWTRKSVLKRNQMSIKHLGITLINPNGSVLLLKNNQINDIHYKVKVELKQEPIGPIPIGTTAYVKCHKLVAKKAGKANKCENIDCAAKSPIRFEWALKKGRTYSANPDDYIQLCSRCHTLYDRTEMTSEKFRQSLMKNSLKLNLQQVLEIIELMNKGMSNIKIAPMYGVSEMTISGIRTGKTQRWAHLKPKIII